MHYPPPSGPGQGNQPPQYQQYPQFGSGPILVPAYRSRRLSRALLALPGQYLRVVTHPSPHTFEQEARQATWGVLWAQLSGYALLFALIGVLSSLIAGAVGGNAPSTIGASLWDIAIVPVFFFIGVGVQFLFARALQGTGEFMVQGYCALLYQVPLGLLGTLVGLAYTAFPADGSIGALVGFVLFAYTAVLNVCMLVAVHRLGVGKAVCVVLVPFALLLCGACALALVLSASLFY